MIRTNHEGPTCGCCGVPVCSVNDLRSGTAVRVMNFHGVREVAPGHHRCDKHVGRLPCEIDGCGRTYRMEEGDSYDIRLLCGRHWRLAPKYMREAVTRVRRMARKHGWSDNLCGRHHRLWNRCLRAIKEAGNLDIARIEREFGL